MFDGFMVTGAGVVGALLLGGGSVDGILDGFMVTAAGVVGALPVLASAGDGVVGKGSGEGMLVGFAGQGESNGSTSVTDRIGGTTSLTGTACWEPGMALSSKVPTTVTEKPLVQVPPPSHVPQDPKRRASATTKLLPVPSSSTSWR